MFNFTKKPKYFDYDDVEREDDFGTYADEENLDEAEEAAVAPAVPVEAEAPSFGANHVMLKIINPKSYEDAREITDFLMNGNTILINMDGVGREVAVRIIDYLRGAIQVVGGMMTKVGKTTLVVAPKNVDVSSIEAMVGKAE